VTAKNARGLKSFGTRTIESMMRLMTC
jgi:hypothetical protein